MYFLSGAAANLQTLLVLARPQHESHASAASAANSHACDRQLRGFDAHFTRTGTAPRCLA
nr:hypothetical protein [Kitasatospora cystarginea]